MCFCGKCCGLGVVPKKVFLFVFQTLGRFRLVTTRTGSQMHKASVGEICPTERERPCVDLIWGSVGDSEGPWLAGHQVKNEERWF